ncbi:GIY-YIG nuclease family protein [Sulfitobacter sp. F26169L]|uniref:GIY-YIG nuclease family protein n=1 Tax=Sulfitobacter sp. F26169L TaxID=2996015 RepID=UPI00226095CE|nr:GIY-YIG nuclease family protein [Sulfitobacter sp. F26169L]MCX7564860.1 GIY-YIG nuclease family protein [Sulfitobacter sp. F26169L]
MSRGRSVRVYLADGKAAGILTAEIMNWTGHVLAAPRTRFEGVLSRPEFRRTGVYLLIGADDEGSDLPKVYVGEGDDIGKRLYSHNKEKDFWDRFIAVTSKDMNLTKAHVRYLEGRILTLLQEAKKAKIENKGMPQFDLLPEADIADMEAFLVEIQLVLPVIGVEVLKKPQQLKTGEQTQYEQASEAIQFELANIKAGITATAREDAGDFIVERGAIGAWREAISFKGNIKSIRDDALQTGQIVKLGENNFRVEEDISFSSPSAAAVFLFGTARNGRTDWIVVNNGATYGAWKDAAIERELNSRI